MTLLAIAFVAALGPSLTNLILALALTGWSGFTYSRSAVDILLSRPGMALLVLGVNLFGDALRISGSKAKELEDNLSFITSCLIMCIVELAFEKQA